MSITQINASLAIVLLFAFAGCQRNPVQTFKAPEAISLTDEQVSRLERAKIFFGHQSVGADIMRGIRDLIDTDPRLKLNIVSSAEPQSVPGPAFIESPIGENRSPQSKDRAFADILAKGMGSQGGIAMYKYCYIDVDLDTDVSQLFANYRREMADLKTRYPSLTVVHITIPITVDDRSLKTTLKTLIGRPTSRDINLKRNQFNALIREEYSGEPVFDLAEVESTHLDGTRSFIEFRGQRVYTLAPEFTTDGGHLNSAGRRIAAERLLVLLARLP